MAMQLNLARMNFREKNNSSGMSINQPFASSKLKSQIEASLQHQRNDEINKLFMNLPLDEDEQ